MIQVRWLITSYIIILIAYFEDFDSDHNMQWGRLYEAQDVKIEWHGKKL